MTAKNIERSAVKLPPIKRLRLIEILIASLDKPDAAIERTWAAESDKRLTAYKKGSLKAVSLDSVKRRFIK
ncbi:MAG: addiction module protein [Candidatus Omnitrophica bacterium]|nr:addiction module protein [Candidatus Omnitrophota bacterium]